MRKEFYLGTAGGFFTQDSIKSVMENLGAELIDYWSFAGSTIDIYQCPNEVVVRYAESPRPEGYPSSADFISLLHLHSQSSHAGSKIREMEKLLLEARSKLGDTGGPVK